MAYTEDFPIISDSLKEDVLNHLKLSLPESQPKNAYGTKRVLHEQRIILH